MKAGQSGSGMLNDWGAPAAPRSSRQARPAPRPPALTGGEETKSAKVDWCTLTWKPDFDEHIPATIHQLLTEALGGVMGESVNGMFGYESGVRFYVPVGGRPVHVGRVDYGGDHHGGRARLDISGAGCSRVLNWSHLKSVFEAWQDPKLTRVDLAVDCLEGEYTVEDAREWYMSNEFRAGTSGAQPRHSLIGDWWGEPKHGRTVEIGRRENGKMCRCYEKGRQLGDQSSPWTRFEVEFRNNDRDLPFDMLTRCDDYFVGAYKCLARVIDAAGERIATHQKEGEIGIEVMKGHARTSYGQVLDVLRVVGLSAQEIIDEVSRPGIPRRLERASLAGFLNGGSPPLSH